MRKLYSFLFALLALCGLAQAQVTVTPSATEGASEGISFAAAKNGGSTAPAYNANGKDLRVYAKGSITVASSAGANMTSIVFNLSAQGKKRLAPITASTGEITAQAVGDAAVTWTGDAAEVTFTVGEKADFGSEGSSKAGQFCIIDFVVYFNGSTPDIPDPTPVIDWTSTAEAPLTVAQALEKAAGLGAGEDSGKEVYVSGKITRIEEIGKTNAAGEPYGNATYYITDDAETTPGDAIPELQVFRGYGLDGAKLAEGDIKQDDKVVVVGVVKNYVKDDVSTIELTNSKLYSLNGETGGVEPEPEPEPEPTVEYNAQGSGILADPYNADAIRSKSDDTVETGVWVKAVIAGFINGSAFNENSVVFGTKKPDGSDALASNITIMDDSHVSATALPSVAYVAPVQLTNSGDGKKVREALNLADNADNLNKVVWLYGDLQKYMGVMGLKNVTQYSFDGETILPGGEEPTPEPAPGPDVETKTIAEVIAAGAADAATTKGTVMAAYGKGFVISDETGLIFIYGDNTVVVGDVVTVSGKVSEYGGCLQISNATITASGTADVTYPEPRTIDGAIFDNLVENPVLTYVTVKGTLAISGNYKNLNIEGAAAVGSLQVSDAVLGDAKSGDELEVTGYFLYKSGSKTVYGNIVATKVEVTGAGEPITVPEYSSIAHVKAAATAEKTDVVFKAEDLLVTFASGKSCYVSDGEDGLLLYGSVEGLELKTGDKFTADVKGQLFLYNGMTEISLTGVENLAVNSSDNGVVAKTVVLADVLNDAKAFESELVFVEDLIPQSAQFENLNLTFVDESDNEIVVRDNFRSLTDATFNTDATYNVTGFVSIYQTAAGTTVQLYPRNIEDIVNPAEENLQTPEAAWSVENLQLHVGEAVEAAFTTNSDGAVTYESSNVNVAVVDAEGRITIVGAGSVEITAAVAATETFKSAVAILSIGVTSDADGTIEKPYSVADVQALFDETTASEAVWVKAFIVASANGALNKLVFEGGENAVASNVMVAATQDETDVANMIPVQLPTGDVRAALNLKDNADNLGKEVWLFGTIEKYFSVAGLKNVSAFSFNGTLDGVRNVKAAAAAQTIYNLAGQRVKALTKGGLYIVDGKKVLVK